MHQVRQGSAKDSADQEYGRVGETEEDEPGDLRPPILHPVDQGVDTYEGGDGERPGESTRNFIERPRQSVESGRGAPE